MSASAPLLEKKGEIMNKSTTPRSGLSNSTFKSLKMSTTSQVYDVKDFVVNFSNQEYYIDKSFQRNLVWSKKKQSSYIQSLADGCASSCMIVADIRTAYTASEKRNEEAGTEFLKDLLKGNFSKLSLDGMQRRQTILDFVYSRVSLDVVLEDLNGNPFRTKGKLFKDFPKDVQLIFNNSKVIVVTHQNTPYSKCPVIFRKINDGEGLNAQEMRTPIVTPISRTIRAYAETTYQDVWPKLEGMSETKIKRMADSETLLHMLMELMNSVQEKDFVSKDHCDNFYLVGEDRHDVKNVPEYSDLRRALDIVEMTMECCRQQRVCKKIPKKTFWAVLFVCREVYDRNLTVNNYQELFDVARKCDNYLIDSSKVKQSADISAAVSSGLTEEQASNKYPDDSYYWRWVNRYGVEKFRVRRAKSLIPSVLKHLSSFTSSKIKKTA